MRARWAVFLLTTLLTDAIVVSTSRCASADPGKAETELREGVSRFHQKRYTEAVQEFARAYEENPSEKYLWNLALSEFRAGVYWAAYQHFRNYKADPQATAQNLAHVNELLAHVREHLGHLTIEAPTGFVISVDGTVVGAAPLASAIDVDPDIDHEITASQGAQHLSARVAGRGEAVLTLKRTEAGPPSPPSSATSVPLFPVSTGLASHSPTSGAASMSARNITAATLAGLALISAGVGVASYFTIKSDESDVASINQRLAAAASQRGVPMRNVCHDFPTLPDCGAVDAALGRWNRDANIEYAAYIAAGGLGLAAVVTFFVWPRAKLRTSAWLLPELGKESRSLTVGGSF